MWTGQFWEPKGRECTAPGGEKQKHANFRGLPNWQRGGAGVRLGCQLLPLVAASP